MEQEIFDYKSIPGWGMDADPENEPTYPMKNYTGDDHNRINYERSAPQPVTVEILKSNERPILPAVFGTSVPPSGLSGVIRRYAFQHSEDRYRHWLPLILADRINVVEGLIDDIKKGHFPNIFVEKGFKASLKYDKARLLRKVFIAGFVTAAVITSMRKKK
ncbi:hypothetical protein EOD41_19450 [Mucilaginibacter limnophilus]|uniref:Uncharacterized protein n=1 Tax=Mucilaginibacter limnophilus TaxID=1932778 RepID=A0A437MHU6_9SPHI|nr:hypothetical protein [Mucilaginibacter limnophilus]RVT97185.1 hypothetical protein EOD41_19450 [Mucilaginibacter limnophilus]